MRCSSGLCRDTKPKSPRHGREIRLPRQSVRNNAATSHPSGSTGPAISYTAHRTSVTNFGTCRRTRRRWLAKGVRNLAPQYCRPRGPAIANHLIRHAAHNLGARRLGASEAGSQSPRTSRGIDAEEKRKKKPQAHKPARSTSARTTTARSTSAQQDERQPPGKAKRDRRVFVCPTSLPRGSWNVVSAATQKPGHSFQDLTRFVLVGLSAPRR